MNAFNKMLDMMHKIYRKDAITREIINTVGFQFDKIVFVIKEIEAQNYLDTATWGLDIYEKELQLKSTSIKYSDRRSVISARWRGSGKLTLELIQQTVNAFTNGGILATFDGTIHINFTSILGMPPNMVDVYAAIESIKPAHLGVEFHFLYRTHQEVARYRHDLLNEYTHLEIREKKLPEYTKYERLSKKTHKNVGRYTHDYIKKELFTI